MGAFIEGEDVGCNRGRGGLLIVRFWILGWSVQVFEAKGTREF